MAQATTPASARGLTCLGGEDRLPACPNCGKPPEWRDSEDEEWPVLLAHSHRLCPFGIDIYHESRRMAASRWMSWLREKFPRKFPAPSATEEGAPDFEPPPFGVAPDFASLAALPQAQRREWMRLWMERMGLVTANQAAPVLALSRQTVERMLYVGSKERTAVTNQTLRVAQLIEAMGGPGQAP